MNENKQWKNTLLSCDKRYLQKKGEEEESTTTTTTLNNQNIGHRNENETKHMYIFVDI